MTTKGVHPRQELREYMQCLAGLGLKPPEWAVAVALWSHVDPKDPEGVCWPSDATLAGLTPLAESSMYRVRKRLVEANVISQETYGHKRTNRYRVASSQSLAGVNASPGQDVQAQGEAPNGLSTVNGRDDGNGAHPASTRGVQAPFRDVFGVRVQAHDDPLHRGTASSRSPATHSLLRKGEDRAYLPAAEQAEVEGDIEGDTEEHTPRRDDASPLTLGRNLTASLPVGRATRRKDERIPMAASPEMVTAMEALRQSISRPGVGEPLLVDGPTGASTRSQFLRQDDQWRVGDDPSDLSLADLDELAEAIPDDDAPPPSDEALEGFDQEWTEEDEEAFRGLRSAR